MEISTINGLFDERRFVIPNYQRAYAWEKDQCSQFIEDLKDCDDSITYYLGHFLFEKDDEKGVFKVIDGQQRLTTCIIFFSAAKSVLELQKEKWENVEYIQDLLDDITRRYIKHRNNPKFNTVGYDKKFFIDAIIDYNDISKKDAKTKSQENIYEARKYFEKRLKDPSVDVAQILKWIEKLKHASITIHVVNDKVEAAQIFAYQNDRGKGLTKLEILKAYLLMQLFKSENSESYITSIEDVFRYIYEHITRISLGEDDVLNYYWRAKGPQGYNSKNTVAEVKEWINSCPPKKQVSQIKEFVDGLEKAFWLVEEIEKPKDSFDKETAFYIENLDRLDNMALSYPLLIRAELFGVSTKTETFARLVKLMENLTFRFLLRGGRARHGMTSNLQEVIDKEGADNEESFKRLIDSIKRNLNSSVWKWYWCDKEMIRYISGWFYGNRVDNYLLWRYEQYLCNENYPAPMVSWEDVIKNESIEHIAPQTPPGNLQESGYGVYNDEKNKSEGIESGEWLNRVGNLVLLAQSQNSALGNRPFEEKLKVYGEDNLLHQQKEIRSFATAKDTERPVWDKAAIERRHNAIVAAAKEIWDLGKI